MPRLGERRPLCAHLRGVAAIVAAGALVAGCAGAGGGKATDADRGTSTSVAGGSFEPMSIDAVRLLNATHLAVTATVPSGDSGCVIDLAGNVQDSDARTVFIQLDFTSSQPQRAGTCAQTTHATVTVTIPALNGRHINVDNGNPWRLLTDKRTFAECTSVFGCNAPPSDHCDPQWLNLAGHSGELPPERSYATLACTQQWLIMNVTATVTGCQPMDGRSAPSGCRYFRARWFFRFASATRGWEQVAQGGVAGCVPVESIPAFPQNLCRSLPSFN